MRLFLSSCLAGAAGIALCMAPLLSAAPSHAAPFEITGHWSGSFRQGHQTGPIDGQFFRETGTQRFFGTLVAGSEEPAHCEAEGEVKRKNKVRIELHCSDGSEVVLSGTLNPRAGTIRGTFRGHGSEGDAFHGTFKITKQAE